MCAPVVPRPVGARQVTWWPAGTGEAPERAAGRSPSSGARRPAPVARDDVRAAISLAFGTSAVDADLRRALERTYLDLDGGHSTAQRELFMSRSSYYRFLQRARHQLVERGTGERGAVTP